MSNVFFIDGVRTPFARAGEKGAYWSLRADDIMVKAVVGLLNRNPTVPADRLDDIAIAATTQQGDQGLTLGRTVGLLAGIPETVPGFAIDRMCAGAMTAVTTMGSAIGMGSYDLALAGGVEHMGHHPMNFAEHANPRFLAEGIFTSAALNMGYTAENLHDRLPHLTKERSDAFALRSQQKAAAAYEAGHIQPHLISVAVETSTGVTLVDRDEQLRPGTTMDGLAGLKTPFREQGNITPGNASPLTDGATVSLLAGDDAVREFGLHPKMRMVSFAFAGVEPDLMGLGPVPATEKALAKAGLSIDDIGIIEANEAFAVQVLSLLDHYGISDDDPRVNPWGGAIAYGHPLASSGVRLMIQLAEQFVIRPDVRYGITTMCVGLGQGGTIVWENANFRGAQA